MVNGFTLNLHLFYGFLLSFGIVALSYRFKSLDMSGALTTLILGTLIFGIGGWLWALPILSFFISASVLSKTGKSVKETFKDTFEKSATRDYGQVLANGGLGGLLVVLAAIDTSNVQIYFYAYLLSFAAANADTWATELGVLLKGKPVLITTFKRVEPGVSGAISFYGSMASLTGSFFIIMVTASFVLLEKELIFVLGIIGFAGSILDSIIGATIQGQYQCQVCQKYTEKKSHCHKPANKVKGFNWMTNDLVNFISISFSVILFLLIYPFL